MPYSSNVFINCPFDEDYYSLLKPLLFTTIYCGLNPSMSETSDGGDIRIRQIQKLILNSRFSIHDISRILPVVSNKKAQNDSLPRFNMPFELGLDLGCKHYYLKDKKCLILEEKPHRYKQVLSDISGQDISSHSNDSLEIIKVVRNWIYTLKVKKEVVSYTMIWDLYNEFIFDFDKDMREEKMDPNDIWEIPFSELIDLMKSWIEEKKRSLKK